MEAIHKSNADICYYKTPNGIEERRYYGPNDYSVSLSFTSQPPHSIQNFHRHADFFETYYVIKGTVDAVLEKPDKNSQSRFEHHEFKEGDVFTFQPNESHNIINKSIEPASFLTFKYTCFNNIYKVFSSGTEKQPETEQTYFKSSNTNIYNLSPLGRKKLYERRMTESQK
jgi:mannose-6-phosphate isomerase-like protein (cupin superfamily)